MLVQCCLNLFFRQMMKKSYIYVIVAIFITTIGFCQQMVGAKGTGLNRADALQDALRNAVGMAVGVSLRSETKVENYMVISDAIASNSRLNLSFSWAK